MAFNEDLRVAVVGAGTMGVGIAITFANAGYETVIQDVNEEAARQAIKKVSQFFERSVAKGKIDSASRDYSLSRLTSTSDLASLEKCDVVCEAIFENLNLKAELFARLDAVCSSTTLFHTNTSTLSVTGIAAGSSFPQRVVGTHYCNPAPLMPLVEVVKTIHTDEDAYSRTVNFVKSLNKVPITVVDKPGFIVNRFLIPFENNAIKALDAGLGTVSDIDAVVTSGLRYPMGPFALLDIVGLDIHKAVSASLYEQLKDPRFAPPPLVDRMIAAGHLGRKTGRGFYSYDNNQLFGS